MIKINNHEYGVFCQNRNGGTIYKTSPINAKSSASLPDLQSQLVNAINISQRV